MSRLNRRRQVDLWSEVFGASAETWPWWSSFKFLDGADWDIPGRVRITSSAGSLPATVLPLRHRARRRLRRNPTTTAAR